MTVDELARPRIWGRILGVADDWQPDLRTILALLAAFTVLWTTYFAVTEAPVAIKHDMAEAYAWGQEFQLGYYQHPPFWAWVCGLWFMVFPRTGWAFALLSSLNASTGLCGAWMLIGHFAQGHKRTAAWMLLLLTPLYTFYAYKYNANIIFLSIWPWTLHYFMNSLQRRGTDDAVGFGVFMGFGLMSKYYALILAATCVLAALQHPARQKYFASASPYISVIVTSAICAPHIVWLLTHQAPPLRYLAAVSGQGWNQVIANVGDTVVGVVAMNLGVVFVVVLLAWISRRDGTAEPASNHRNPLLRILVTLVAVPTMLTIGSALVLRTRITSEMTVGTFPLLPLLVMELAGAQNIARLCSIAIRLAVLLTLGAVALSPAIALSRTWLSSSAMKVAPFQEVAVEATRLWHERTPLPLTYVTGSDWYDNTVAFYSPDRPHAFVHFEYYLSGWVSPEAIARHGLLAICVKTDSDCLAAAARFATPGTTKAQLSLAHRFWGHVANPVDFVVAVIPPRT